MPTSQSLVYLQIKKNTNCAFKVLARTVTLSADPYHAPPKTLSAQNQTPLCLCLLRRRCYISISGVSFEAHEINMNPASHRCRFNRTRLKHRTSLCQMFGSLGVFCLGFCENLNFYSGWFGCLYNVNSTKHLVLVLVGVRCTLVRTGNTTNAVHCKCTPTKTQHALWHSGARCVIRSCRLESQGLGRKDFSFWSSFYYLYLIIAV